MPMLNPSIALSSPMLQDPFVVRRRTTVIAGNGRSASSEERIEGLLGVIVPGSPSQQERGKDYATGQKSIVVITTFRLREEGAKHMPDLVVWRGDVFQVDDVRDLTTFGEGYVRAVCISQDIQDVAPGGK